MKTTLTRSSWEAICMCGRPTWSRTFCTWLGSTRRNGRNSVRRVWPPACCSPCHSRGDRSCLILSNSCCKLVQTCPGFLSWGLRRSNWAICGCESTPFCPVELVVSSSSKKIEYSIPWTTFYPASSFSRISSVSSGRRSRISVLGSRPPGQMWASFSSTSSTRKSLTRHGTGIASASESLWPCDQLRYYGGSSNCGRFSAFSGQPFQGRRRIAGRIEFRIEYCPNILPISIRRGRADPVAPYRSYTRWGCLTSRPAWQHGRRLPMSRRK